MTTAREEPFTVAQANSIAAGRATVSADPIDKSLWRVEGDGWTQVHEPMTGSAWKEFLDRKAAPAGMPLTSDGYVDLTDAYSAQAEAWPSDSQTETGSPDAQKKTAVAGNSDNEVYIDLDQAGALLAKKRSHCTLWKWCACGKKVKWSCHPVKLRYVCIGHKFFTTKGWLDEFIGAAYAPRSLEDQRRLGRPGIGNSDEDASLGTIAKDYLGIETLSRRDRYRLDFHNLPVWQIRDALRAAFRLGRRIGRRPSN